MLARLVIYPPEPGAHRCFITRAAEELLGVHRCPAGRDRRRTGRRSLRRVQPLAEVQQGCGVRDGGQVSQ
uniref:hypothetical protein n=1 Tax=Streptomyces sp. NBC_01001 TaxID=2903713 RepID=UPI002F914B1F|nr:hypothetical protein OG296_43010 [Streptomyces sp. NBC_01001]